MKRAWPVITLVAVVVAFVSIVVAVNEADDEQVVPLNDAVQTTSPVAGATTANGVTRIPLGFADPTNAPGQTLYLQRVLIEPHARLGEHFHAGTQVARILAGTLSYTIVKGTATITRDDGRVERVSGPKKVSLASGDWIVETNALEHFGANDTDEVVLIELAALLARGAPLATPVGTSATGTPLHVTTDLRSPDRRLFNVGPNGSFVYGWNHLTGTSPTRGGAINVDLLGAVNYKSGSGPFSGFVTFTFPDGSSLAVTMQGATEAATDTENATFLATLGVIGGTGRYENATGSGTFVGSRDAALGGAVAATFDLILEAAG